MSRPADIVEPPPTLVSALGHLGPGIVLASSIVGSGELIATTASGAEAGFALLWLIVLGCVIKVAAQVEIGRHTLAWGRTPLAAFDRVPGPRLGGRGWIFWGRAAARRGGDPAGAADAAARLVEVERLTTALPQAPDTTIWVLVTALVTAVLLAAGRYSLIERLSVVLVGTFTLVTLLALALLQGHPAWAISGGDLLRGLVPAIPPAVGGRSPLATALATFGIIGVGASELMIYPYWCLEKGYGRAVGPRDSSPDWARRARGWLRVMQLDAWTSLAVYTLVTTCFYLLGAATLGRLGIVPAGSEMVRTLGAMYAPVFGGWANRVFLAGAFAVLYSTLFVAAAGNARMVADGLILAGRIPGDETARALWTRWVSVAWVAAAAVLALAIREPVTMVLASGFAQAMMLAALAVAVLWFRHGAIDPRLTPSRAWDLLLWASAAGFLVVGLWTAWQKLAPLLAPAAR